MIYVGYSGECSYPWVLLADCPSDLKEAAHILGVPNSRSSLSRGGVLSYALSPAEKDSARRLGVVEVRGILGLMNLVSRLESSVGSSRTELCGVGV